MSGLRFLWSDCPPRSITAFLSLLLVVSVCRGQQGVPAAFTSSNLPIVVIETNGQVIKDEPKIVARMGIIDNGPGVRNALTDPHNNYDGFIGIEIRGSSTQQFPKKQYAVETRDSLGNDNSVSLLGFPAESDWVLSAPYNDKSLMRDALVFLIARSTGRYASRARFCELVLNGDYMGVYVLFEKIKRDKNRVNIAKLTAADTTGDALTGGYIVKVDKVEGTDTQGWYSGVPPYPNARQRTYYQFHYPKYEDLTEGQRGYIERWIRDFDVAMSLTTYADSALGYPHYLDVGAAVDATLLNELSRNVDEFRLSAFLTKDRDSKGGKLVAGPLWDYNLGFGNSDYYEASQTAGFQMEYMNTSTYFKQTDDYQPPFWWPRVFNDPPFQQKLADRWSVLRAGLCSPARLGAIVDSLAALLAEAQVRNFERWPVLGIYVWPNAFIGQTFAAEVAYLKSWIASRIQWLDGQFGVTGVGDVPEGAGRAVAPMLMANYPNPFNPTTNIRLTIVNRQWTIVKVFDLLGREVAMLVNETKDPGTYLVRLDGTRLPSGTYICRLTAGTHVESRRMVLIR
jgi:hypothetical protein